MIKGCLICINIAGLLCLVLGLLYLWNRPIRNNGPDTPPQIDTKTEILERIHLAGELTTGIASIQTIVKSSEAREMLRLQVGSTEILYIAVGEVRAGINLMELDERNLVIDGNKATVIMPECRILDSKIDVNHSYVFDVKRSLVLSPQAIHLQTAAERQALKEIQETAVQTGLLDQAQKQAEMLVRYFLESAGIREVAFQAKE